MGSADSLSAGLDPTCGLENALLSLRQGKGCSRLCPAAGRKAGCWLCLQPGSGPARRARHRRKQGPGLGRDAVAAIGCRCSTEAANTLRRRFDFEFGVLALPTPADIWSW